MGAAAAADNTQPNFHSKTWLAGVLVAAAAAWGKHQERRAVENIPPSTLASVSVRDLPPVRTTITIAAIYLDKQAATDAQ